VIPIFRLTSTGRGSRPRRKPDSSDWLLMCLPSSTCFSWRSVRPVWGPAAVGSGHRSGHIPHQRYDSPGLSVGRILGSPPAAALKPRRRWLRDRSGSRLQKAREPAVADTFSKTLAESYAIECTAFEACWGVQTTIWKSRRLIQESRQLMAEADQRLNRCQAELGYRTKLLRECRRRD
jgi:hypothetical protein